MIPLGSKRPRKLFLFLALLAGLEGVVLGQSSGSPAIVPLTNESVQSVEAILGGDQKVWFVKFFAPWCNHCQKLAPEWEALSHKLADDHHRVRIAEVDVSANEAMGRRFNIQTLPNMKLFSKGKVYEYSGARDQEAMAAYVMGGEEAWGNGIELAKSSPKFKDILLTWIISYMGTFTKILFVAPSVFVPPFACGMCFGGIITSMLLRGGPEARSNGRRRSIQSRKPTLSEHDEEIILSGLKEE